MLPESVQKSLPSVEQLRMEIESVVSEFEDIEDKEGSAFRLLRSSHGRRELTLLWPRQNKLSQAAVFDSDGRINSESCIIPTAMNPLIEGYKTSHH